MKAYICLGFEIEKNVHYLNINNISVIFSNKENFFHYSKNRYLKRIVSLVLKAKQNDRK